MYQTDNKEVPKAILKIWFWKMKTFITITLDKPKRTNSIYHEFPNNHTKSIINLEDLNIGNQFQMNNIELYNFNVKRTIWLKGYQNSNHIEPFKKKTLQKIDLAQDSKGSNPARGQVFAMLISCSRCSNGSMWLPFW